ncbi:MAG: (2Fe-2S)-binding protein [Ilumatobacteraceae bacterium]
MVVCHCLRINDRVITQFTADPSVTTDDITAACGAGGECGGCRPTIDRLLAAARAEHALSVGTPVASPQRRGLVSAA